MSHFAREFQVLFVKYYNRIYDYRGKLLSDNSGTCGQKVTVLSVLGERTRPTRRPITPQLDTKLLMFSGRCRTRG